jgi:uncharacterized metal-binding protein
MLTITEADVSDTAKEHVRLRFNPSGLDRVAKLKLLQAAFITECEAIAAEGKAGREAAVAITNAQTASMWAVSAATKGL